MVIGLQPGSEEGMLKAMVSPAPSLFAWLMAHRSEDAPGEHIAGSAVVVTVRVVPPACTDTTGAARLTTASVAVRSRQRHFTVFSLLTGPATTRSRRSRAIDRHAEIAEALYREPLAYPWPVYSASLGGAISAGWYDDAP
jgi:hypothetical protein